MFGMKIQGWRLEPFNLSSDPALYLL